MESTRKGLMLADPQNQCQMQYKHKQHFGRIEAHFSLTNQTLRRKNKYININKKKKEL